MSARFPRYAALVFLLLMLLLSLSVSAQRSSPPLGPLLPVPPPPDDLRVGPPSEGFTLVYPSTARPARITRKFIKPRPGRAPHEGVDLYAPAGTPIIAGAAGKVKKVTTDTRGLGWGTYVQIHTPDRDSPYRKFRIIYANLSEVRVQAGDQVQVGDVLGVAAQDDVKLVVRVKQGGLSGFAVSQVLHPKKVLVLPNLRLRPTDQNLRLRAEPNTDSEILGLVDPWDLLVLKGNPYKAFVRAGKEGKWLKIIRGDGAIAWVAAWFVDVVSLDDPGVGGYDVPPVGMNLDLYESQGTPQATPLANLGWVRLAYNLSFDPQTGTYGNTDLDATYARYYPVIKRYADNGNRVILVFTHQLYGEGQGYVWENMTPGQWDSLTAQYVGYAQAVAAQYAGEDLVHAYQIWNEQDSTDMRASVPVPVPQYANLLAQSVDAIRAVDPEAAIISGGHITGPTDGVAYANAVLSLVPPSSRPDGIAFHPYGRGPSGSAFSVFGDLGESIRAWSTVLPGQPVWITEWGVLDRQGDDSIAVDVTAYANGFLQIISEDYDGAVAAAVWYAWADGMDNGYGLVRTDGSARQPLYNNLLNLAALRFVG